MAFSITDFIAATQDGLAREAHFELIINLPSLVKGDSRKLTIMCNSATLPGRHADITQIRRFGQGLLSPYATGLVFDPLNVTFYCDSQGNTIKSLQSWMDTILDMKNVGQLNLIQYKANYSTEIVLNQYASDGTGIASYRFFSAFPSSIGPVNFGWAARDSLVLVPATFVYTLYEVGATPPKSIPNISTTPQTGQNNKLPVTGSTPI